MTAEIAIMNSLAIALAADSAVTIGGAEKIYTSADKLFQLTENSPIAAMVYGDADLLGIPWETIIKLYRKHLGNKTFPQLEDYVKSVVDFMCCHKMFSEKYQDNFVAQFTQNFYSYFIEELLKPRFEKELKEKQLTENDVKKILADLCSELLNKTKASDLFDNLPDNFLETLKTKYESTITQVRDSLFQEFPIRKSTNIALINIVYEILRRQFGPFDSGLVLAGFGDDDHFPKLTEIRLRGIAANRLLYHQLDHEGIEYNNLASVSPFAQHEMVSTFMEGIDPELKEMIEESTRTLFKGAIDIVFKMADDKNPPLTEPIEANVRKQFDDMVSDLIEEWEKKRRDDYWGPIIDIVASLPKDELGAMAEALVNLTKFKRRVSRQQETVGGPIDVAVITKGDGFIWIKRKHYFQSELNPRFISKYYNRL